MNKKIITLQSCPKHYTYDQDKACSPEETVARFQERLRATRLDILEEIRRIDNGRLDIPVYFSVCGVDAHRIIGNKKQMGKGSTPEQSRASACMELGERFSFFSFLRDEENFLTGDYDAMEALDYPVLPIETLLHSVHDVDLAPETLRQLLAGLPLQWTWALRLSDNTPLLVPFSWFYAINEFNGPSAGNTYEEAVIQGISEVIERHVCALITRDHLATPKIDPKSITDPVALELLAKFNTNGIQVRLNDFSLDTGIPTIGALAWDPATFPEMSEIVYTAGTTPDANKALIRALTEVAQLAGDFNSGSNYVASGCGMGYEATMYLLERGIRLTGTDAWSWDAPFVHTAQKYGETKDASLIWEGHKAGRDIGYCHLEKLHNLEVLPPTGFYISCFPHKIRGASAGWTRAVAIFDDALMAGGQV